MSQSTIDTSSISSMDDSIDEVNTYDSGSNTSDEEESTYRKLLEVFPVGLYVWKLEDPKNPSSLRLKLANAASEQYTGLKVETIIGKRFEEVYPSAKDILQPIFYGVVINGKAHDFGEVTYKDENISERKYRVKAIPCIGSAAVLFEQVYNLEEEEERKKKNREKINSIMEKAIEVMTSESPNEEDFAWMSMAIQSLLDFADDTTSSNDQKPSIQVITSMMKELSVGAKLDGEFVGQFLITFRYFLAPGTFFKKLVLRYATAAAQSKDNDKKQIQQRIYLIIKEWIQKHFYDFENDQELFKTLQNFANNTVNESQSQTLTKLIEKQLADSAELKKHLMPDPKNAKKVTTDILQLKPDEVARQITLLAFNRFKRVKPVELYFQTWSKENKKVAAPNASAIIDLFNKLSSWVASEVVSAQTLKRRTQVLKFFISVGWAAYGYRDYETTFMIVIGLSQFAVSRLSETWRSLDPKTRQQWHKISTFASFENNYKNYRAYMKSLFKSTNGHNVLPYFGLYLKDLTAIEEGSGNYDSAGSVNYHKMKMVSSIIAEIQKGQQSVFAFATDLTLMSYLSYGVTSFDEDTLYALSKRCEASSTREEEGNGEKFKPEHEPEMVVRNPVYGIQMPKTKKIKLRM